MSVVSLSSFLLKNYFLTHQNKLQLFTQIHKCMHVIVCTMPNNCFSFKSFILVIYMVHRYDMNTASQVSLVPPSRMGLSITITPVCTYYTKYGPADCHLL